VQALWSYVKLNQLQDKVDRRMVRADDALRPVGLPAALLVHILIGLHEQIFNQEAVPFQALGNICQQFMAAPEPVVLHYTIDPSLPPPEKHQAWDVEVGFLENDFFFWLS
jgi:SWI/SNF-related matrix-associated actin-dependent regulator of chromatin subfamily D